MITMTNETTQELDTYNLSDDELLELDLNAVPETDTEEEPEPEPEQEQEQEQQPEPEEKQETDDASDDNADSDSGDTDDSTGVLTDDYEAFYQALTKPFKANGKELKITDPNDAIRLMQMGANYSKKMQELKPKQALLKTLEANGLDESQLGFAIDLLNKKPEAIAKFIKDNAIDSYEVDTELANDYNPNLQVQMPTAFEDTVAELVETYDGFGEVLNQTMSWDSQSKQVLFDEPNLLKVIAEQKQTGMYDEIMAVIEKDQLLGRLNKPILEAYVEVESRLLQSKPQAEPKKFVDTRPTQSTTQNNDKKKQATGITKTPTATTQSFDPLKVSDEELLRLLG